MPLHVKQPDKPNEKNWDKKLKSTYVCTANISDKLEWYSRQKILSDPTNLQKLSDIPSKNSN